MCFDPVTLSALALSAGGTFLEQRNAAKNAERMQSAKEQAFSEGLNKQTAFGNRARESFNPMVQEQGAEGFTDAYGEEVSMRNKAFGNAKTADPDYSANLPSTPKNVVLAQKKAFGEAAESTKEDRGNLARLGGYSGTAFKQGLDRNQYARDFSNLSGEAVGQARLLPLEMSAAYNNAYKSPGLFPTLLKLGGQVAGLHSAGGGSFGGLYTNPNNIKYGAVDPNLPWKGGYF